jgi:hypothetical protein
MAVDLPWARLLPRVTEEDFTENRRERAGVETRNVGLRLQNADAGTERPIAMLLRCRDRYARHAPAHGRSMIRPVYLTKGVRVGIILTLASAGTLVFLVFFARQLHSGLVLTNVVVFQLCFIWTCAELLDGPGDDLTDDEPRGQDFTH